MIFVTLSIALLIVKFMDPVNLSVPLIDSPFLRWLAIPYDHELFSGLCCATTV